MFSPLAAGRKVYGNGSYAPNRGQLNPAGYIKRELAKRGGVSEYGGDGASDTRSGIAANALRKNLNVTHPAWMNQGNGAGPHPVRPGPGGPNNGTHRPQPKSNKPKPKPVKTRPGQGKGGGRPKPGGNATTPGTSTPPATTTPVEPPAPPPPPQVKINQDGTLELPYNPEYADNVLVAQQQYQQNMLANQQESQNENIEYQTTLRDGQYAYQDQRRGTLNENASGGTAFSSKYGAQVGDNARVYNNALNDLNIGHNVNQQRLTAERSNNQNTLNQYLQSLALKYGIDLSGQAGSLGLGPEDPIVTPPLPPATPKPAPKPKPTPKPKPKPHHKPKPSTHHKPGDKDKPKSGSKPKPKFTGKPKSKTSTIKHFKPGGFKQHSPHPITPGPKPGTRRRPL